MVIQARCKGVEEGTCIERDVRGFTSDTISFTNFCGFVSLEGGTYFIP